MAFIIREYRSEKLGQDKAKMGEVEGFQLQSQYIKDLYKSIDKGLDLPPPPLLTGPSGDILVDVFDPRLLKTIKKLNKHRKKLLKENKIKVTNIPFVPPPTLPDIYQVGSTSIPVEIDLTLERDPLAIQHFEKNVNTSEVEVIGIVKIDRSGKTIHEFNHHHPDHVDDLYDNMPDQIIANANGRKRTRSPPTRNYAKIAKRKTIDELSKEIEKEKRLVTLEPLSSSVNIPADIESPNNSVNEIFVIEESDESEIYASSTTVKRNVVKRNSSRTTRLNLKDSQKAQKMDLNGQNLPLRKSIDELSKDIEKEKRLIILLEPLSVNFPAKIESPNNFTDDDFEYEPPKIESSNNSTDDDDDEDDDGDFEYELPKKKKKKKMTRKRGNKVCYSKRKINCSECGNLIRADRMKLHLQVHSRARENEKNAEKINCSECGILIWNYRMEKHLKVHSRENKKVSNDKLEVGESKICPYCGCCEQNIKSLNLHIATAHEGSKSISSKILQHKKPSKSICCSICLENFDDEKSSKYFLHMKTHDKNWKISCSFCNINISNFDEYTRHILTFHPYQCPKLDCNDSFMTFINLKEHMREKHLKMCKEFGISIPIKRQGNKFICNYCPSVYTNEYRLNAHLIMHEDPDALTCTKCPRKRIFKDEGILKKHMKDMHGEKTIKCTFEKCLKMFTSNEQLRQHLYYHNPNSTKMINRKLKKGIQWWKNESTRARASSFDSTSKNFTCDTNGCDKVFSIYPRYKNHVSVFHTDIEDSGNKEIISCPIEFCAAKSQNRKVINFHIKYEHKEHVKDFVKNAEKKFKCSFCDRFYNYQHALKDHEISHTDPDQTTCDIPTCMKFYISKTMKNSHMKEAHGSKQIECSFPNCTSKFSTEVCLKKHEKWVHGKIKNYYYINKSDRVGYPTN